MLLSDTDSETSSSILPVVYIGSSTAVINIDKDLLELEIHYSKSVIIKP